MSTQFPFIGHRPVRVHIMGTDEQPVADADSAEQLAVMFFDLDSAVNVAVGQCGKQHHCDTQTLPIQVSSFAQACRLPLYDVLVRLLACNAQR